jgi:hypothetical protein
VMEKTGKGSIVFVGSNYGLVGPDQRIYKKGGQERQTYKPAVYSVCKAGLLGLTKFMAAYYMNTSIRINMLTPSGVWNQHDDEFVANYSSRTILGRMSEKNEYRGAIIFLASDASSYMTGANLVIDGGWTALWTSAKSLAAEIVHLFDLHAMASLSARRNMSSSPVRSRSHGINGAIDTNRKWKVDFYPITSILVKKSS